VLTLPETIQRLWAVAPLSDALPSLAMPKTTRTYWNPLSEEHRGDWQPVEGLERMGDYASRPPGEAHGPFRTDEGCLVLEMSYPSQTVRKFAQ